MVHRPTPAAKKLPVSLCVFQWISYDGNCKKVVVRAHSELLKICTKYGNRKEEKLHLAYESFKNLLLT